MKWDLLDCGCVFIGVSGAVDNENLAVDTPFGGTPCSREARNRTVEIVRSRVKEELGKVAYHVPCHLRVQNIGLKTRDILNLIPGTTLEVIERCSGHDGTYAVKQEFHEQSMKIAKPVVSRVAAANADYHSSDCPMAGHQITNGLDRKPSPSHPMTLLRLAYGVPVGGPRN